MRLIRPVAERGVAWLARRNVDPQHVVLAHGFVGLAAAGLIALGGTPRLWIAAALLLTKVVLDNIDGALARTTDRVTLAGRYLDTVVDFVVNIALFAALAAHGPAVAAAVGFLIVTLVLSFDYNLERLYQEARSEAAVGGSTGTPRARSEVLEPPGELPIGARPAVYATLRGMYRLLFAPQDRLVEAIDQRTFTNVLQAAISKSGARQPRHTARLAWNDLFSTAAFVNLGLSTQLSALAVALVAAQPFAYVWLACLQAPYAVCVWLLRVRRFREYLRSR